MITLPSLPETFYGEDITVKIDEEIIREIYEARTIGRERELLSEKNKRSFEELCGVWGNEEDRADIDRMVAAIHILRQPVKDNLPTMLARSLLISSVR